MYYCVTGPQHPMGGSLNVVEALSRSLILVFQHRIAALVQVAGVATRWQLSVAFYLKLSLTDIT
jgi:hypothetical protein